MKTLYFEGAGCSNADISKARKMLGYEPEWDFESGIRASIEWYIKNI